MKYLGTILAAAGLAALPLPVTGAVSAAPATLQSSTCYKTFWPSGRDVEVEACEYNGGSSGFTNLYNNSNRDMSVCWTFHFGNGRNERGCNFNIRAGEKAVSACYSCNRQHNGGMQRVTWREVKPAN